MSLPTMTRILVFVLLSSTQCNSLLSHAAPNSNKKPPQQNGSVSKSTAACAIEMRTDAEGVDFSAYLRDVYLSVKKRWFANMPPAIEKGQQGTNTVEFRILRDGSVPKDSVK